MAKEKSQTIEVCSCNVIHEDRVKKVKQNMIDENILNGVAQLLKIFGDTTRIKIIDALFINEMCVCDLAAALGMTQSAISHQLRLLKSERIVKYRREGKVIYYSLDDQHVKDIFDIALRHIKE